MKNIKLLGILLLFTVVSCSNQEDVVLDTWPDGSEKLVVTYEKRGQEKVKLSETGFYENGSKKYSGSFNDEGKRQGRWFYWYQNGQLWSQCDYNNGLRDGKTIIYYENGQKRYEGQFQNDQNAGIWNFWDSAGNLETTVNYQKE